MSENTSQSPTAQEVAEQLSRIVSSPHFRNSRRYPAMLSFLVDETLAGRADSLKERTLGVVVFGRKTDYDTAADPVVRVSAGEIRKRIAQYYQGQGSADPVCFELPVGSYVPQFSRLSHAPRNSTPAPEFPRASDEGESSESLPATVGALPLAPELALAPSGGKVAAPDPRKGFRRERLLWIGLSAVLAGLCLVFALVTHGLRQEVGQAGATPESPFWNALLQSSQPALLVVGVHSFDDAGHDISYLAHTSQPKTQQTLLNAMTRFDMVSLSDLVSCNQITAVLVRHAHPFGTQGAGSATLTDLSKGPVVLVGGFNNLGTMRLQQPLRYRFMTLNGTTNVIQDAQQPGQVWTLDTHQNVLNPHRDYALVSSFFDPQLDQPVMLVAGIGRDGTQAAVDFVSKHEIDRDVLRELRKSGRSNFEVMLYTDVVEGSHGPSHVMELYTW